ncbi:hypothetical protein E2C01_078600 [Portunus trituberculatus]|uniref:Uncharacterized protein n=1 Tax=Portunus trituberculatus TaxID=210409 RepID=A0A5B7IP81_PORTR|nr:hypothetical protein [Portunus trituberculatus]
MLPFWYCYGGYIEIKKPDNVLDTSACLKTTSTPHGDEYVLRAQCSTGCYFRSAVTGTDSPATPIAPCGRRPEG